MTLRYASICKGCWQQMHVPIALRGLFSTPFRAVGIKPSRMNPNLCTICETMFEKAMKARVVTLEATVLFADLRGYTRLSKSLPPESLQDLLDAFYDTCAAAIWQHDGLLNKTIGDAVMAVFNFPIRQSDHARQALIAGGEMQAAFAPHLAKLSALSVGLKGELGIGVAIDSGRLSFGEFGRSHRDLTAIGTVVNTAARAQAVARPGEILVTEAVHSQARSH
jgi:class 3 adenylate cyclase